MRGREDTGPIKTKIHVIFSTTQRMRIVCTCIYKHVHVYGGQRSALGAPHLVFLRQGLSLGSGAFGQVGRLVGPTDLLPLSP